MHNLYDIALGIIITKWLTDREQVSDPTTLDNQLLVVEPTTLGELGLGLGLGLGLELGLGVGLA